MAFKDDLAAIVMDVLRTRMIMGMLTEKEKAFTLSLMKQYEFRGSLTEKQLAGARKLAVRLIGERDSKYSL